MAIFVLLNVPLSSPAAPFLFLMVCGPTLMSDVIMSLTPFTLTFECRVLCQFSQPPTKVSYEARGEISRWLSCASRGSIRGAEQGRVSWCSQSDTLTNRSLNNLKRNDPQSNISGPNNSSVVTGSVFGSLYEEKNTTVIHGEVSVTPSVLLTLCHISAQKTVSVNGKIF